MTKIAVVLLLLIAAFLGGYLPEHSKVSKLEDELREAKRQSTLARLRDLSGLAYIQASQKNYGLASKTSAAFFKQLQEVVDQTADATAKQTFQDLLSTREKIAAELEKGDAEVMNDLHPLFVKTQQLAGSAAPNK